MDFDFQKHFITFIRDICDFMSGNIIDMYDRRARAYELSRNYSIQHKIRWDLILFLRLDSGIYSPRIELNQFFNNLMGHRKNGSAIIYSPVHCNFAFGTCMCEP